MAIDSVMEEIERARSFMSLEMVLHRDVLTPESRSAISTALRAGKLVIIRDAVESAFAERTHAALDQATTWKVFEGAMDDFHYRHHNIYDPALFPDEVLSARELFAGGGTKQLMTELSGRDCAGDLVFGASRFMPGDFQLPHSDATQEAGGNYRAVAYLWHLTKGWEAPWGGQLYWAPTQESLEPAFNVLYLFNVLPGQDHFVCPVSPYATGKRLTINGWWTGADPLPPEPPHVRYTDRITVR